MENSLYIHVFYLILMSLSIVSTGVSAFNAKKSAKALKNMPLSGSQKLVVRHHVTSETISTIAQIAIVAVSIVAIEQESYMENFRQWIYRLAIAIAVISFFSISVLTLQLRRKLLKIEKQNEN